MNWQETKSLKKPDLTLWRQPWYLAFLKLLKGKRGIFVFSCYEQ